MSQSLTNDLPDKFGSSDEDDDDEEVVGWIGDTGEFEGRTQEQAEFEDDDEDEADEFGRRGLFHQRWDGDYHEGDEFGFRSIGSGIINEEPDANVTILCQLILMGQRAPMTKRTVVTKSLQMTTSAI